MKVKLDLGVAYLELYLKLALSLLRLLVTPVSIGWVSLPRRTPVRPRAPVSMRWTCRVARPYRPLWFRRMSGVVPPVTPPRPRRDTTRVAPPWPSPCPKWTTRPPSMVIPSYVVRVIWWILSGVIWWVGQVAVSHWWPAVRVRSIPIAPSTVCFGQPTVVKRCRPTIVGRRCPPTTVMWRVWPSPA